MAIKKTKYDLLLKSLGNPEDIYHSYFGYFYYDEYDDSYDDYYVEYSYLEDDYLDPFYIISNRRGYYKNTPSYRKVDMNSIYSKERLREIKINQILGNEEKLKNPTFGDLIKKNKTS
jgi:hypothetical protein